MSKTYVQLMQAEIDGLKAERDEARRWLQWIIDIARAGDAATLASATDAADQWLHRDDPPEQCDHSRRWNLEDDGGLTCCDCGASVTLLDPPWLDHTDDPAAFGPEVAACAAALQKLAAKQAGVEDCPMPCDGCEAVLARGGHCPLDDHTAAALGWAGAGAEEGLGCQK
jgi:hypothetical protein